jgi:hypothetical protein
MNKLAFLLVTAALFSPCFGQVSKASKIVTGEAPQTKPTPRPLLAGQVKGVLYHSDGARFVEGISVFVADVIEDETKPKKIDADLTHKTNRRGEFTLENVTEGRHGLWIFIPPKPGEDVNTIIHGLIVSKTKPVYFTMPAIAGIDLGKIEVTSIKSYLHHKTYKIK